MSLEDDLRNAKWLPSARREVLSRALPSATEAGRALLAVALATHSAPALELWGDLVRRVLPADAAKRLTPQGLEHALRVTAKKTVKPAVLRAALDAVRDSSGALLDEARASLLALGNEVSLANAHGIYVAAARKADPGALPKSAPHLDGPVPELTIFQTAELTIALARLALSRAKSDEGLTLLKQAEAQLAWERAVKKKGPAPVQKWTLPGPAKAKGPGFALARAAAMEACNVFHVSGRGTSIKGAVQAGLALGEAWWLEQLDEALMLADARSAFEKRGQSPSAPVEHLVWRGGDGSARLWLVRLANRQYALLARLGRTWQVHEGDLESVAATLPEAWFARAMPCVERRR
jgi:hypothetical protein